MGWRPASPTMTDWLPFAFVLSAGVFTVLWLLVGAVEDAGAEAGNARKAYWVTVALTGVLFVVYLVAGETWLWY